MPVHRVAVDLEKAVDDIERSTGEEMLSAWPDPDGPGWVLITRRVAGRESAPRETR